MTTVARVGLVMALSLVASGCRSSPFAELESLADTPSLPYSILLSGGAFVSGAEVPEPLARTFPQVAVGDEAFTLEGIVDALRRGGVFERAELDVRDSALRGAVAGSAGPVALDAAGLREFLEEARAAGHDFLVVVEQLEDREVQERGINGQWPITASVWLLIGLGMVIPDHTYESRAALRVSVRDVHSGRIVFPMVFDAGPVDLSLLERTDFLGLLTSILVPPFWVGDDPENVVATVQATTRGRLVVQLARELKSLAARQRLRASMPAAIDVQTVDGARRVRIESAEGLSFVRMTVDGRRLEGAAFEAFELRLLQSAERGPDGINTFVADYTEPLPSGSLLRVLVQTVSGSVASTTVRGR